MTRKIMLQDDKIKLKKASQSRKEVTKSYIMIKDESFLVT